MKVHYALFMNICFTSIYTADIEVRTPSNVDFEQVSIELLKDHPEHIDIL